MKLSGWTTDIFRKWALLPLNYTEKKYFLLFVRKYF